MAVPVRLLRSDAPGSFRRLRAPHTDTQDSNGQLPFRVAPGRGRGDRVREERPQGPQQSRHPVRRRRRHRSRHLARLRSRVRRRDREGLRRRAQGLVDEGLRRRGVPREARRVAARRDPRGVQGVPRLHQGTALHAGRRRHPLPQRDAAPGARPLRVHSPGALLRGRRQSDEGAREAQRRDLPREHGGRLRRHRVEGRLARGRGDRRVHPHEVRQGHPRALGDRHQADVGVRLAAAREDGGALRAREQPPVADARAQGQHHEVHRGRLPRLGLRRSGQGVPGADVHRSGALQGRAARRAPTASS